MDRFAECLMFIVRPDVEGGFVDDPVDRGGATNKGITQRTYTLWLKQMGMPYASVRDIPDDHVAMIYHDQYWIAVQADYFQKPMDLVLFDSAVCHGPSRAIKLMQKALGMQETGILAGDTLAAAQAENPNTLAIDTLTTRCGFYEEIIARAPSQNRFREGWANRVQKVETEAEL